MTKITKWDYELAEQRAAQAKDDRELDEDYPDVVSALQKLDIDPRRLRDYLACLS